MLSSFLPSVSQISSQVSQRATPPPTSKKETFNFSYALFYLFPEPPFPKLNFLWVMASLLLDTFSLSQIKTVFHILNRSKESKGKDGRRSDEINSGKAIQANVKQWSVREWKEREFTLKYLGHQVTGFLSTSSFFPKVSKQQGKMRAGGKAIRTYIVSQFVRTCPE